MFSSFQNISTSRSIYGSFSTLQNYTLGPTTGHCMRSTMAMPTRTSTQEQRRAKNHTPTIARAINRTASSRHRRTQSMSPPHICPAPSEPLISHPLDVFNLTRHQPCHQPPAPCLPTALHHHHAAPVYAYAHRPNTPQDPMNHRAAIPCELISTSQRCS